MIAEKIKILRESAGFTQATLANKLGITRSSVNAWELGISIPSTQYIVELSNLFNISTDYLLNINNKATIDISDLNEEEVKIISELINYFKKTRNKN